MVSRFVSRIGRGSPPQFGSGAWEGGNLGEEPVLGSGGIDGRSCQESGRRLGRVSNSPPQLGQTSSIPSVQDGQNVHSKLHIWASAFQGSPAWHFSHSDFISNAMAVRLFMIGKEGCPPNHPDGPYPSQ